MPFDWTVGANVTPHDKSMEERAHEMRAQYLAMTANKDLTALALLPSGVDASAACAVM